jgi:(2R)-ethylmalonyl-CoA mutase
LTEQQPENNVYRILLEMLAVTLSKRARARAVQRPAGNEALGLPRPWDQQWSIRLQQIVAFETDIAEFEDIFDGSPVIAAKVAEIRRETAAELARIEAMGGAVAAVESGYMKQRLVRSNARRVAAIEAGEQIVVGANRFTETEPSPLSTGDGPGFVAVDETAELDQIRSLKAWRAKRDGKKVAAALDALKAAARENRNVMEPSIACAHAGVTTGEWGQALREVFGEYRAPTGVGGVSTASADERLAALRKRVAEVAARLGRPIKLLVGKPGLDGHSNGAEQIAVRARDAGLEVIYEGIRLTPAEIAAAARDGAAHVVGLSILSGGHLGLVRAVIEELRKLGLGEIPVVVGGIIPLEDARALRQSGIPRVYTPKDYDLTAIIAEIVELVDRATREAA